MSKLENRPVYELALLGSEVDAILKALLKRGDKYTAFMVYAKAYDVKLSEARDAVNELYEYYSGYSD